MKLAERQERVIAMLADGMRDKEIAEAMMLNQQAVRQLIWRAVHNLGAKTRCEAVAIYVRQSIPQALRAQAVDRRP